MKQQKWKSKSFALLLAIMMIFTMMPQMAFADGTAVIPQEAGSASSAQHVIVSTATELAQWGGVDFTGTIELAADIDMSGKAMEPIKSLNGTFEGNGYTISNLTLSGEAGTRYQDPNVGLGLLAQLNGSVQNLKMENVQITSNSKSGIYAGAIVGIATNKEETARIVNCSVYDGKIDMPKDSTGDYAGGIVGGVSMFAKCIVENCVSKITVNSGTYAGGLIGGILYNGELEIRNCAVLSDVNIFGGSNYGGGGVIGYSKGKSFTAEQVYFGGVMGGDSASKKGAFVYEKRYFDKYGKIR